MIGGLGGGGFCGSAWRRQVRGVRLVAAHNGVDGIELGHVRHGQGARGENRIGIDSFNHPDGGVVPIADHVGVSPRRQREQCEGAEQGRQLAIRVGLGGFHIMSPVWLLSKRNTDRGRRFLEEFLSWPVVGGQCVFFRVDSRDSRTERSFNEFVQKQECLPPCIW